MSEQQPPAQPPQEPNQFPTPNTPPPGYPPPHAVPPGYPPPNAVPPGYPPPNVVPPGYPPPGYMPPPGYGPAAPQPGYGAPQPPPTGYPAYPQGPYYQPMIAFPPPREYAAPPAFPGQPWQIVPPAEGSLFQAWVSVGTKLTRQNIASWAQASKRGWTAWSIVTYLTIVALPFFAFTIVGAIAGPSIVQNLIVSAGQTISAADMQSLRNGFIIAAIVIVVVIPLFGLAGIYASTFFWSLFMPPSLGTIGERMRRAIKPYALILPASGLVTLVTFVVAGGIVVLIASTTHFTTTGTSVSTQVSSLFSLGSLIFDAFSIALSVYTYALLLQSGSVGTTLSRIAVFGIQLLAGFVIGAILTVLLIVVSIIVATTLRAQPGSNSMLMPLVHTAVSMLR